jgi:hypothetical protein
VPILSVFDSGCLDCRTAPHLLEQGGRQLQDGCPELLVFRLLEQIAYQRDALIPVQVPRNDCGSFRGGDIPHALCLVGGRRGPPTHNPSHPRRAIPSWQVVAPQWFWGVIAALFFAVTIHASIVLLFSFVPFPMAAFRHGYDFSFIPSLRLKWLAVVVSATSAGICEETGFRRYMQRPIEQRHGVPVAILISALFFTALQYHEKLGDVSSESGAYFISNVPMAFTS